MPHINPPFDVLGNPALRAEIFNSGQSTDLTESADRTWHDDGHAKQSRKLAFNPQSTSSSNNLNGHAEHAPQSTSASRNYAEQVQNLELSPLNTSLNNLPQTPDTTKQKSPPEKHHSDEGSDMRMMVALNNLDSNLLRPLLDFRRQLIASGGDKLQPAANEPKKPRHITHQTRLNPKRQKQAALRYAAGEPVKTICADFKIHRSTLHDICKRLGVEREQASQRAAQKSKARELYQDGYTLADIAKRFNVSPGTIRRMLEELGVGIRPRGRQQGA